jgi:hypothetical protein
VVDDDDIGAPGQDWYKTRCARICPLALVVKTYFQLDGIDVYMFTSVAGGIDHEDGNYHG